MLPGERSRDVFEEIEGMAKPPLAPLPAASDYGDLERHGFVKLTPRSRRILDVALAAVGFPAFYANLEGQGEALLRGTNMREDKVFGPAYSATVVLEDDPRMPTAIQRAATLVVAARKLCDDVMTGKLEPDTHRGEPLEMGQYPNLFSTSVAAVDGRPRLYKDVHFDRVAVVVRRCIYTLRVGAAGEASVADVAAGLAAIVADADRGAPIADDDAPGALSAGASKTVAKALVALEAHADNAASLRALRESFVVLCLDLDDRPGTAGAAAYRVHAANPANRWYLASLQIVVFGDAKAGGICSFPAYLDGNVMMRGAAELQRRAAREPIDGVSSRALSHTKLTWRLDRRSVRSAWRDVRAIQDPQGATFEIADLGRDLFEARGLDAVSAFVLALGIATTRCAGELPNVLQLVTVSKFRCVPVGAAVITTNEVRRFVDLAERGDDDAAAALLVEAIGTQARECRSERRKLSLRWLIEAFVRTRRGPARAYTFAVLAATGAALTAAGCLPKDRIILSHPEIFPEVALLGRPGVRLPYVSHYGLHYQMFADRTVLTIMPGAKWRTSNADFTRELERALRRVLAIADARPRADASQRPS